MLNVNNTFYKNIDNRRLSYYGYLNIYSKARNAHKIFLILALFEINQRHEFGSWIIFLVTRYTIIIVLCAHFCYCYLNLTFSQPLNSRNISVAQERAVSPLEPCTLPG